MNFKNVLASLSNFFHILSTLLHFSGYIIFIFIIVVYEKMVHGKILAILLSTFLLYGMIRINEAAPSPCLYKCRTTFDRCASSNVEEEFEICKKTQQKCYKSCLLKNREEVERLKEGNFDTRF